MRIAIHGGAGAISRENITAEKEEQCRMVLLESLTNGYGILQQGGTALDSVEAAVKVLEDSPLFNAGRGSVLTHAGTVEMDAAIMDGKTLQAGAVASITETRNPIGAARAVLEHSDHVLLMGLGANAFCRERLLPVEPAEYFKTEERIRQWQALRETGQAWVDHTAESIEQKHGTVGAVAVDQYGNLAAATSTGGMTNKKYGRVGDSPLIGIGTYADNATCAVSATGYGEYFIRAVCAHDIAAMIKYGGLSLHDAVQRSLSTIAKLGGDGGVIAVDAKGNLELFYTSAGMYRGWSDKTGQLHTAIFGA